MKRFSGVCLITRDVQRLRQFYCDLLDVDAEGDDLHAAFATAGANFSLVAEQELAPIVSHYRQGIGRGGYTLEFAVEDVDQEYQRLVKLAIPIVRRPMMDAEGQRSFWFHDPDGNIINFYHPLTQSQNGEHKDKVRPVDSKELVRHYFERLLNQRDLSVCDELLACDYCDHDAPAETPPGPQGTKAFIAGFLADYPNLRVDVDKLVSEGDRVAARLIWHGTHAKTSEPSSQVGIVMMRLNGQGQLAERWSTYMFL